MKIIRPEQPIKKKEENLSLIVESQPKEEIIGNLMDDVIAEKTTLLGNKWQVTIYFTERQYNLWKKKGGEKWLKRALVGQKLPKKR